MGISPTIQKKRQYRLLSGLVISVLILIALFTLSSGCIRMLQKNADSEQAGEMVPQETPAVNSIPAPAEETPGSLPQVPVAQMTPEKSDIVTEVTPYLTPDPYPILHGQRINGTPQYNPLDRDPDFEKDYHLTGDANGLLVNVVEGPLYIVFVVKPNQDCLLHPDDCKGTLTAPVTRPYLTITVRDNQTQEVVAEDGYGREYSSDTGNYEWVATYTDTATGITTTNHFFPGPRFIPIYKEGVYHITIEGNYLDVNVKILTGDSPSRLDVGNGDTSSSAPTPAETPPDEEFG